MGWKTRHLLAWWLGGLVTLTALTGITAQIVLTRIRRGEDTLRANFAERSTALERLRGGVYLSGSLARDYFAAPSEPDAPRVLEQLKAIEADALGSIARYAGDADAANLRAEATTYWKVLHLMADVASSRRTPAMDTYFRKQLQQRRHSMMRIADEIGAALDRESRHREAELAAMYSRFRWMLSVELVLVAVLVSLVSLLAAGRLLRLESEARALSTQLLQAQEQERRAIARELHDQIGQALSSLLLDLGKAAHSEIRANSVSAFKRSRRGPSELSRACGVWPFRSGHPCSTILAWSRHWSGRPAKSGAEPASISRCTRKIARASCPISTAPAYTV